MIVGSSWHRYVCRPDHVTAVVCGIFGRPCKADGLATISRRIISWTSDFGTESKITEVPWPWLFEIHWASMSDVGLKLWKWWICDLGWVWWVLNLTWFIYLSFCPVALPCPVLVWSGQWSTGQVLVWPGSDSVLFCSVCFLILVFDSCPVLFYQNKIGLDVWSYSACAGNAAMQVPPIALGTLLQSQCQDMGQWFSYGGDVDDENRHLFDISGAMLITGGARWVSGGRLIWSLDFV